MTDIGNASKNDLLAEVQRASTAEASLVSGTKSLPSGGSRGLGLWSDTQGQPQYTDRNNGTRALALETDVSALKSAIPSSSSAGYKLISKQVFSTPGQYSYTPTPGSTHIIVKLCGGGGGGGGVIGYGAQNDYCVGFGGTGSTYAETNILPVPSDPVSITVGAGGAGGNVGGAGGGLISEGSNGGISSFGTYVTCPGGTGGSQASSDRYGGEIRDAYQFSTASRETAAPSGDVMFSAPGGMPTFPDYLTGYYTTIIGSAGGGNYLSPATTVGILNVFSTDTSSSGTEEFPGNAGASFGGGGGGGIVFMLQRVYSPPDNVAVGGAGAGGIVIVEEYA